MDQAIQATETAIVYATMTATAMPPSLRGDHLLHDVSLITGEPCAPPCWRGITPGITKWGDALVILRDDPAIDPSTIHTGSSGTSAIYASFAEYGGPASSGQFLSDGETVDLIRLRLAPGITLGEVVAVYGDPVYAIGEPFSDSPPQAMVQLVYPERQMIVYVFVAGRSDALDPDSEVIGVLYTTRDLTASLLESSSYYEWEGFASFETYGPDASFELTAVLEPGVTPENAPAAVPTFPPAPAIDAVEFDTLYLHPTGIFAIAQPTGFDQATPNTTAAVAQVNMVNAAQQSVIDAFVQDPGTTVNLAGLDAYFSAELLDSTWGFFSSWRETDRQLSDTSLTIDFALTLNEQQYVARQRAWTDGVWVYSVRVLTPANATGYLHALLEGTANSMLGFTQFASTPLNWSAFYDHTSGAIIRYPSAWQVTDGGAGRPTTTIGPDGATLRVDTYISVTADSRAAAESMLHQIDPNAAIKSAAEVHKGGTDTSAMVSGWQFNFTTTTGGDLQWGHSEVLSSANGNAYAAVLRAPVDAVPATGEFEQIMSTFGVLPLPNLSGSSQQPGAS